MADESLGLGVLFTGAIDSSVNKALTGLERRLKRLSQGIKGVAASATSLDRATRRAGGGATTLSGYIENLRKNLKGNDTLLRKSIIAANTMGKTYGTSSREVLTWSKHLDKSIGSTIDMKNALTAKGQSMKQAVTATGLMRVAETNMAKAGEAATQKLHKGIDALNQTYTAAANATKAQKGMASVQAKREVMLTRLTKAEVGASRVSNMMSKAYGATAERLRNNIGYMGKAETAYQRLNRRMSHLTESSRIEKKVLDSKISRTEQHRKIQENYAKTRVASEKRIMEASQRSNTVLRDAQQRLIKNYPELGKQASMLAGKIKSGYHTYDSAAATLDRVRTKHQSLAKAQNQAVAQMPAQERMITRLGKASMVTAETQPKLSRAFGEVSKRLKTGTWSADKASVAFERMNRRILPAAPEKTIRYYNRLGNAFKTLSAYGIASLGLYGMINALRKGGEAIVDFDQSLRNLQAITGATDAQVEMMGETIKAVARDTKFSAAEASQAMVLLGQAGLSAQEAIDSIGPVTTLATGTLSTMASTADLVTTSLRAFNLDATESSRIADIFAAAVNKSKMTIDKLRTSFNYLAPIAAKAGLSLEETAASTMILANSGIRASTIGTGLRQVLSRLVSPNKKLREAFHMAGADVERLNPLVNDFSDVIAELSKVVVSSSEAFELFGLRGAPAVAALTSAGVDGFNSMSKEVARVGAAAEMAAIQMEGLGLKIKNLMDRLKNLAIALGEGGISGMMHNLIDLARSLTLFLTKAFESPLGQTAIFTTVVLAATAAVFGLLVAGKALLVWAGGALVAFIALNPILAIITGTIIGLTAAWAHFHKNIDASITATRKQIAEFETLGTSVDKYNRRMKTAEEGTDEYKRANLELKKEMEEVASTGGELSKVALQIASSITKSGEATAETTRLMDIFAKKQNELLLQSHAQNVNALMQKYKEIQKEVSGTTGKSFVSSFFGTDVADYFFGKVGEAKKELTKAASDLESSAYELVKQALDAGALTISNTSEDFIEFARSIGISEEALIKIGPAIQDILHDMQDATVEGLNPFLDALLELDGGRDKVEQLNYEWEKMAKGIKNIDPENLNKLRKSFDDLPQIQRLEFSQIITGSDERIKNLDLYLQNFDEHSKELRGLNKANLLEMTEEERRAAVKRALIDNLLHEGERLNFKATHEDMEKTMEESLAEHERITNLKLATIKRAETEEVSLYRKGDERISQVEAKYAAERRETMIKETENKIRLQKEYADFVTSYAPKSDLARKANEEVKKSQQELSVLRQKLTKEEIEESIKLREEALVKEQVLDEAYFEHKKSLIERSRSELANAYKSDSDEYLEGMRESTAEEVELAQEYYQYRINKEKEMAAVHEEGSVQHKEAINETMIAYNELLATVKSLNEVNTDITNKKWQEIQYEYQLGEITKEQYLSYVEIARQLGIITDLQSRQIREAEGANWDTIWDAFIAGAKKASKEADDIAQTINKIGGEIADNMATGLTDAIMALPEGFDAAASSFKDFAASYLKEIASMITKTLILNAIKRASKSFSGMFSVKHAGGVGGVTKAWRHVSDKMTNVRHSGGVGADEVLTVVRKNEGVFTPEQMRAMGTQMNQGGQGQGGGSTINVPITVNGADQKLAEKLQDRLRDEARSVMREEMSYG